MYNRKTKRITYINSIAVAGYIILYGIVLLFLILEPIINRVL